VCFVRSFSRRLNCIRFELPRATPSQDVCSLSRHILDRLLLSADPRRRDVGGQEVEGRIVGQRGGDVGREKHRTARRSLHDDRCSLVVSAVRTVLNPFYTNIMNE